MTKRKGQYIKICIKSISPIFPEPLRWTDFYCASALLCWRAVPSVCLSRCVVSKRLNVRVLSSAYRSPIILVFLVLNILAKFGRGPPTWALNTGWIYTFRDFMLHRTRGRLADATKGVTNVSSRENLPPWKILFFRLRRVSQFFLPREKLSQPKIYASGSSNHHQCPMFFPDLKTPP